MRSRTANWFETRVRYDKMMEDGQNKKTTETYVVDAYTFGEAEEAITKEMGAYINLDDATHVDFLAALGPVPETVCLRYNPGGSFSLGNTIMDMPRDAKYGMTEDQMAGAINRLTKLGTKHFGIHAFLASNTTTTEYYPELAGHCIL